jgi:hypothetical protein
MTRARIHLLLAVSLSSLAASLPAVAAETGLPTLETLLSGVEACFNLGGQADGSFQRFKLKAEPAPDAGRLAVIPVHAVEHGLYQGGDYANMYAGTGTLGPAVDGSGGPDVLEISLIGAGFDLDAAGVGKLFTQNYVLALDPATFAGTVYGAYSESKPLENGAPYSDVVVSAVSTEATPISCDGF